MPRRAAEPANRSSSQLVMTPSPNRSWSVDRAAAESTAGYAGRRRPILPVRGLVIAARRRAGRPHDLAVGRGSGLLVARRPRSNERRRRNSHPAPSTPPAARSEPGPVDGGGRSRRCGVPSRLAGPWSWNQALCHMQDPSRGSPIRSQTPPRVRGASRAAAAGVPIGVPSRIPIESSVEVTSWSSSQFVLRRS